MAAGWEGHAFDYPLARLVRLTILAEGESPTRVVMSEVRALEGAFGLTPSSLQRLGWTIGEPPASEPAPTTALRQRLRVVEPDEPEPSA